MKIGDIASFQNGYAFKSKDFISNGTYKIIKIKELKDGKVKFFDDSASVNNVSSDIIEKYIVNNGDILFALTGDPVNKNNPLSWVGRVSIYEYDTPALLNQRVCKMIPSARINPRFIYYYFREFKNFYTLASIAKGSASQANISTKDIEKFDIDLPSLDIQNRIVEILDCISNKINKNKEINNNLFEQMQALYKAWFVDFEPFGGVRPSNWNDTNIYAIANIIYGAPFASKLFNTDGLGKPIIRIRDLKEQAFVTFTTEEHPKGHLIQPGDIVVGMDGEFRPYIWGNEPAWLNQRVCIFESNRPQGKAFVLYTIKPLLNKIEQTQVATTVIHIGKKDFDAFEIVLPDEATLDSFDSITAPMIEQIVNNRLQNKRLAVLRDTLLPKLMSGELDISDIDL
mgnify:CR=1 FL=1